MYNDSYQKKLERDLKNVYEKYIEDDEFDNSVPDKIRKQYEENKKLYPKDKHPYPLVEYKIRDGKVSVKPGVIKEFMKLRKDARPDHNLGILRKTLEWCEENNLEVPNTTLYIWIGDKPPSYIKNINKFPIFVYAKPENMNIPIFPDNTFYCFQISSKYKGKCCDWDVMKRTILTRCSNVKKEPVMYFKGANTTNLSNNIRSKLKYTSLTNKEPMVIKLDAWENWEPITNFCKYSILLNLPGRYPWSNRLKYLFLMDSIIININVETDDIDKKEVYKKYISFVDFVVDKGNYVELLYKYKREHENLPDEVNQESREENQKEYIKLVKKINRVYKNKDDLKYKKIANNSVKNLTNDRIYSYLYRSILLNSELLD